MKVNLEPAGWCRSSGVFHLHVESTGPLNTAGAIDVTVTFEDKFRRVGKAVINAPKYGEMAVIEVQMGDTTGDA
jgi:hypothetical protein